MWGGGRPHVERPTGTAGEEGAGMRGGGRLHVERPTGTAGMAEVSGLHVESPAEEEMQIERGAAREAVKEAMRKGRKTEKEVYEDMSLRLKQRRERGGL